MTISDSVKERMESLSSSGSTVMTASLLWLTIVCAQHTASEAVPIDVYVPKRGIAQTNSRTLDSSISDIDVLIQLKRFYADLVDNQMDFPIEEARLLSENLWDLYA